MYTVAVLSLFYRPTFQFYTFSHFYFFPLYDFLSSFPIILFTSSTRNINYSFKHPCCIFNTLLLNQPFRLQKYIFHFFIAVRRLPERVCQCVSFTETHDQPRRLLRPAPLQVRRLREGFQVQAPSQGNQSINQAILLYYTVTVTL